MLTLLSSTLLIFVQIQQPSVVADICGEDSPWWCIRWVEDAVNPWKPPACSIHITAALDWAARAEREFLLRQQCTSQQAANR